MPAKQRTRADVELRLPADSAYVSVLRTTTAGLAARLDFPIDDIKNCGSRWARRVRWSCPRRSPTPT